MAEASALPLRVVDGFELADEYRVALRPGELMADRAGRKRRLPRYFFEVESWDAALRLPLAEHFMLWEFMDVDMRENSTLLRYPRYVPCAVTLMAAHLEILREVVGTFVHIAANGGYRSPTHKLSDFATPHCWGTGVDIYRIGDDYLTGRELIERYSRLAIERVPALFARPYGHGPGEVDDHIHLDLGYATVVPRDVPSDDGQE